ncbi:hypothetical protein QR46_3638 [Giardia duodenalis assemblage B]|uniref:Uncharacterized protein n=3 Tax=Giardia intestinalis TaxID=5741 RepID=A0A132NQN4_GIAIN|nr:Hypothetical protein GL50581_3465 [Giardia intestinalis ATCC 50581]ESU41373.1 Hypothetical protein GSB_153550 [Giardia intestinalis]KWX12384.1 hypothetical protein QR46_3638 [Giardia intestinalis assemblage B]
MCPDSLNGPSSQDQYVNRLELDISIAQNELEMMRFGLQRLEESRRAKLEKLTELRNYYQSLKQESAIRTAAAKERQYPLLWLCTGLSVGVLFLLTKTLLLNT